MSKREIKEDSKNFWPEQMKEGIAINCDGRDQRRSKFWGRISGIHL